MEIRRAGIIRHSSGGTAKGRADSFKLSLPTAWVRKMGVDGGDVVEMAFDGEQITVKKLVSPSEFGLRSYELGHDMRLLKYYSGENITSIIYADFTDERVMVENFTDDVQSRAFGCTVTPSWEDLQQLLSDRCVPRERFGIREYLESIGVDEYDPIEIISKTKGKMAEDNHFLVVENYEKNSSHK